jgi:ABC-type oligopeptide transport system ATPase subunit
VAELLERVGMPGDAADRFPNAFSGGQRQRIGIARTLILHPRLVVADESVSALDITIQKQVLDLLQSLQQELQLTYIFVSHDLRVVRTFCDDVAVMHRGRIVERGPAEQVFRNPQEPYTQTLCRAIPSLDPDRRLPTAASAPAQEA